MTFWVNLATTNNADILEVSWTTGPPGSRVEIKKKAGWAHIWSRYLSWLSSSPSIAAYNDAEMKTSVSSRIDIIRKSFADVWNFIADVLPPSFADASFFCTRDKALVKLSTAACAAASDPKRARCRQLPIDFNPYYFDISSSEWGTSLNVCHPRTDDIVLVVGADLGLSAVSNDHDLSSEGIDSILSEMEVDLRSLPDLKAGIASAKRRGVTVIENPDSTQLVATILQCCKRGHLQLISHLECDESSGDLSCSMLCSDGRRIDLCQLTREMVVEYHGENIERTSSVDLRLCSSAGTIAPVFYSLGFFDVCSVATRVSMSTTFLAFRRIYENNLLDGTRSFAHAWITAGYSGG